MGNDNGSSTINILYSRNVDSGGRSCSSGGEEGRGRSSLSIVVSRVVLGATPAATPAVVA